MRWLPLRFDFDSTSVRLLVKGHQGHCDIAARRSHADMFINLVRGGAAHNGYGRKAHGMVAERSDCSRIDVESYF